MSTAPKPQLDLTPLEGITVRLRESLDAFAADSSNLYILDSVVKRFELTYELSFRFLRRYLIEISPSPPTVDELTFAGLIRSGDRLGLLRTGWPGWKEFKDARNETVHTYQEAKARDVAAHAANFLPEAEHLLAELKARTMR